MYLGVGIPSAKGTGTNGFVERALGYLPKDYKPGSYGEFIRQMKSNPAPIKRKINDEIILHEEKHKIEVDLYDLKEKYINEKKYTEKEIEEKINQERKRLYHLLERREADFLDKNETHQKGKLKDAQMRIIKNALKIKDGYYLGEGFEYGLQADMNKNKKLKKENKKKKNKHHKDEHKHKKKSNDDKYTNDYYDENNDDRHKRRRKDYYKKEYKSYDRLSDSQSRSRSRSSSKNYNRNIKNELNNDYRINKKYKFTEPIFKRSPSHKEENKDELQDENNKEKKDIMDYNVKDIKEEGEINNINNEETNQNINTNEKNKRNEEKKENYNIQNIKENEIEEHEEGSIKD